MKFLVLYPKIRTFSLAKLAAMIPAARIRHLKLALIILFLLGMKPSFPVVLTNCSNNYGPYHFPEKLIPVVILNAVSGKPIPIYGDGSNIRDWLC